MEPEENDAEISIKAEAFDIMQNYYRTVHRPLIRCMLCFSGRLDANALRRAAALSTHAVPEIACRFDPAVCRWKKSCGSELVSVLPEADAGANALLTGVDFEKGPQLRLVIVRGRQNDTLCAIVSHLVMDGGGFKEYLYLLADLYSKCLADPAFNRTPKPGDRSLAQIFSGYSLKEKQKIIFTRSEPLRQEKAEYPPLEGDREHPFWTRCVLGKDLLSVVRRYGKSRGASVNDLLLAAYARALRNWVGSEHIEVPCPVDLRKYKKDKKPCGFCNLTGNYRCAADIPEDEPFDETLLKISAQMSAQKKSAACLQGPAALNLLFHLLPLPALSRLFPKIFKIPVVSYTNLGILDERRLVFSGAEISDAFFVTAVKSAPYFQVSVSTWKGVCTLSSAFYGTPEDEEKIRRFLNDIRQELENAVGFHPSR